MKTLSQIFSDHDGKVVDKWASYIEEYERRFASLRNEPVNILEIGVQNGGSLEIWDKYFSRAKAIIGCDINPACQSLQFGSDRIHVVIGDASSEPCAIQIAALAPKLDIVIDDGSHHAKDVVCQFSRYFPALEDGGLYVIEDLHCSYWSGYEGGLTHPYSATSFLKALTDIINRDHWGIITSHHEFLRKHSEHCGVQFDENSLARIHSITFLNSLCVIRKADVASSTLKNALGQRRVIGHDAQIIDIPLNLAGQDLVSPDQSSEPWTKYASATQEQLTGRISDLEKVKLKLNKQIAALNRSLLDRDGQISAVYGTLSTCEGELSFLKQMLTERDLRITALEQVSAESASEVVALRQTLAAREEELATVKQRLTERDARVVALDHSLAETASDIGALRNEVSVREVEASFLAATISALHTSTSWRITRPLRAARRLSGKLSHSRIGYPLVLAWRAVLERSLVPLRSWRTERAIAESGMFHKEWYLDNNPDVVVWGIDPIRHYVSFGAREWRDPSPLFNTRAYLANNPDVAAAGVNPFAHFILHGDSKGRPLSAQQSAPDQDSGSIVRSECLTANHRSTRTSEFVRQKVRYSVKGMLGARLSAYASAVIAATRFRVRKLHQTRSFEEYREAYLDQAHHAVGAHSLHYGARLAKAPPTYRCDVRLIAYYLPQYHPIPENDEWWGAGFTEWRNIARAFPVFAGHNQPQLPGELGYYDLRIPEVMRRQIELAKLHGVFAFCFHFYWFGGKRLLELPIENFIRNSDIDFKFCLCWANENWTRRWDGADQEVLISQAHSAEDDICFLRYLTKYFCDPRYLTIRGKPVLTVYRPGILPDPKATVIRWRAEAERAGFPGIYLIATNSFGFSQYREIGFDALSEFPPHGTIAPRAKGITVLHPDYQGDVFSYSRVVDAAAEAASKAEDSQTTVFPGVMPCWDNTPRRPLRGNVFNGSTPTLFYEWLRHSITRAGKNREDERIVFINAWNEWAEGAYLEPDRKFGYAYLAACAAAISDRVKIDPRVAELFDRQRQNFRACHCRAVAIHLYYEELAEWFAQRVTEFGGVDVYITVPRTISWDAAQAVRRSFNSAYVLEVDNRGRDFRPFLTIYPRFLEGNYEFVCKLHSKRSPHLSQGDRWREDIVDKLLGTAAKDALTKHRSELSVGILAPRGSLETLSDPNIRVRSEGNLISLASRLNCKITFRESFVAGSMFWFRPLALQNIHQLFLQGLEFEPELGQVDGTVAHAIERIVCIAAKTAGMSTREFGQMQINRPSQWA